MTTPEEEYKARHAVFQEALARLEALQKEREQRAEELGELTERIRVLQGEVREARQRVKAAAANL